MIDVSGNQARFIIFLSGVIWRPYRSLYTIFVVDKFSIAVAHQVINNAELSLLSLVKENNIYFSIEFTEIQIFIKI